MGGENYELIGGPMKYYKKRRYIKKPRTFGHTTTPKRATTIFWQMQLVTELRDARLSQGITQFTLGKMLGTNQAAISKFELGQTNPSLKFITTLAAALGVEIQVKLNQKDT